MNQSINSSKSQFYLAYNSEKKTKICFYINKRLNTNKWSVTFSSTNAITLKLKIMKNEIEKKIWIHNIYNFSSSFYSTTKSESTLSIIEKCVNEIETNHILLNDFNLHHSFWNESSKFTQHVMTNQLIDIINEANMKLILSQETITWEAKNFQNILDLIFMSNVLINKIKHCKTRSEINQSFDHISIFTKLLLKIVTTSIVLRKLWKSINVEKIKKMKKKISSIRNSKTKSQINESIKKLQNYVIEVINRTISWKKTSSENKSF